LLDNLQTRSAQYEVLNYADHELFDETICNLTPRQQQRVANGGPDDRCTYVPLMRGRHNT